MYLGKENVFKDLSPYKTEYRATVRSWLQRCVCLFIRALFTYPFVESSWNVMAHGDAREWKWRGNWRMEWIVSTLHTTSERGVSSITTTDAHTSAASSRLNWRPCRFKLTRPFRRKTKSGFCACAITFQLASTPRTGQRVVVQAGYSRCDCDLYLERCSVRMSTRAPSVLTAVSRVLFSPSKAAP